MKKLSYFLMLALAMGGTMLTSCSDDDNALVLDGTVNTNTERLFMPMFRQQTTTNKAPSADEYHCDIAQNCIHSTSRRVNDIQLYWYGVEGAKGYRLTGLVQGKSWDEPETFILDTIVGPDVLELLVEDLAYKTGYHFSIQALSPRGEQYNSKWFGRGDSSHQSDQTRVENNDGAINTGDRYAIPEFLNVGIADGTVTVYFARDVADGDETTYQAFINAVGGVEKAIETNEDGEKKWILHQIVVKPADENRTVATLEHTLTPEELVAGKIVFPNCLTPEELDKAVASATHPEVSASNLLLKNASYIVDGLNNNSVRYYDRQFNKTNIRMPGELGEPVHVAYLPDPQDTILLAPYTYGLDDAIRTKLCRLDTVLNNYMSDLTLSEGTVFELDGDGLYYIRSGANMSKGFTLRTKPEDAAQGKRATVYLGVGYRNESLTESNSSNFNLGRNAASSDENGMSLTIMPISFEDINFCCMNAINYCDKTYGNTALSINGNYFINMSSQGLSFTLGELNVRRCSFSGAVRGFIRFQGPNKQLISHLNVEECVFYNCGVYDTNGRGYAWFAGPGNNRLSNFYENLSVKNNTFINSPRHAFVQENGDLNWPSTTRWNVVIENNTFINLSQRSKANNHGRFIEAQKAPKNSTFRVQKNLFVQVKQPGDDAAVLYLNGGYIDRQPIDFDFADNYATTVPTFTGWKSSTGEGEGSTLLDGLFTIRPFSDVQFMAGYDGGSENRQGLGETKIKFGDNLNGNEEADQVGYQLKPEELFVDPFPIGKYESVNCHRHNNSGFYLKTDEKVTKHPIYTKNIGDQRWKTPGYFDKWFVK